MIRELFLKNLHLKVTAVISAILLWLFVVSRGQTELSLTVPIEFSNIPAGIEIAKRTAKSANLAIRVHESVSKNVRPENVRVTVDVGKAKEGEMSFAIRKDDVKLPNVGTVVKVEPPMVKLMFEETVSKTVAVRPVVIGSPAEGYLFRSLEYNPQNVVIEGPRTDMRRITQAKTEPVAIAGLTEDSVQDVGLELPDGNIRTKTERITVKVRIGRVRK